MVPKFKIGGIYSVPIIMVYYIITHIDKVSKHYKVACYSKLTNAPAGGNNFSFSYMEAGYTKYVPYSLKKF